MTTTTFCQEVESGVTQQQIDQRVNELKTLGGAIDAYAKTVGGKRYICAVREVFDEPIDDELNDPERAGPVEASPSPTVPGGSPKQAGPVEASPSPTVPGGSPKQAGPVEASPSPTVPGGSPKQAGPVEASPSPTVPGGSPKQAGPVEASPSPTVAGGTAVTASGGPLTDADYRRAAATLGCEAAAIRAVGDVESGGRTGFLPDGRPKILFESCWFSKLTRGQYDATHPDISTARWIRNYVGGAGEYDRLERAIQLDREAALKAASWGKFQILGINYSRVGSRTVDEFVVAQKRSEQEHLDAFVKFILSHDLSDELRDRRWADFACRYNGPRYAKNHYDEKMAAAYAKHSRVIA